MIFGLRDRRKYNGTVDTKLNNEYGIATRDNDLFPGLSTYLGLIDTGWNARQSEDDCALMIATMYCSGLAKHGFHAEAQALEARIVQIVSFGLPRGMIDEALWTRCRAALDQI